VVIHQNNKFLECDEGVILYLPVYHGQRALVASGSAFQVFHAAFFVLPAKKDTVSHPVRTWNTRSAYAFPGPRKLVM
jgi:hypothetical protein